ncbi:hypothetical protein Prudu_016871, partial [Prunus dulcis]
TRIGVLTKKLRSKHREGQNRNLKKSDFISPPLPSLSSLSPPRALDPQPSPPFQIEPAASTRHGSPATGPVRRASTSPSFPGRRRPQLAVSSSETGDFRWFCIRTSSHSISLISPPILSSEAPGVQLIHRRDLREVQLARTSSRRRTKETTRAISLAPDPPPKCRSSLGDSAEFSAEVRRKLIKEGAKRSFVPDIRQAPGVQLIHRRDLREVQLARTSSRRRTKETTRAISLAPDPPPKCRSSL